MQSITGTWQMIRTECLDDSGDQLAPPYGSETGMGLLSLRDDGRMVCVLCDSRAELPQNQAREYNSYCGAYHFDGAQLTTRVDASANTDWIGSEQIRDVSFEGEIMVLRPVKNNGPSSAGQRVLYWVRLPAVDS